MADDINKKIIIDVEINNDGQSQVNQYKSAFNSLQDAVKNLGTPLKDLSSGINTLNRNLSQLSSSGKESKNSIESLGESFLGWRNLLKESSEALGEWGIAISGGISLLLTYGPEILKWIGPLCWCARAARSNMKAPLCQLA
ncbi:MAG: hypothetical protein ACTHNW_18760 [Mucilaginibacter sp.]